MTGWQQWVAARMPCDVVHLDVAGCGRVSRAAFDAEVEHLRREARCGGYLAELDAEPLLASGRSALAAHVGLAGRDVAFFEGAGAALAAVLAAWPLPRGAAIGTVPSEFGGNARKLRALAADRGWRLVPLPVDRLGRVADLPAGLDLVTLPHVASQRGVAQPVPELLGDVPVVLDVAQSLGQTPVPPGCAAYVGTSRKWLSGPRGVGFAVLDPAWEPRLADPPTLGPTHYDGARRFDSTEAHVAGRAGLAIAAQEWTGELLPVVHARAARLRAALADSAWRPVEPVDEPTGITTVAAPDGHDVGAVRERLLRHGVLTSVVPQARAEDLPGPVLRLSTAAWVSEDDVDRTVAALHAGQ